MDLKEVFDSFDGIVEYHQDNDCDIINQCLDEGNFGKHFDAFILNNVIAGITPKHAVCHLFIHFYRLGLIHTGVNKDVEELQKLYKTERCD